MIALAAIGALYAASPGHGRTVVVANLVAARGTARHARFLGLTVTATRTFGVYALGFVTLYLSQYILPERLYPILQVTSGLLVVGIGAWLFATRLRWALRTRHGPSRLAPVAAHPHAHDHGHVHDGGSAHTHASGPDHGHAHEHPHEEHEHDHGDGELVHSHGGSSHSHLPPGADGQPVTWRSLLALGVSGGLVPCPSALVVLLSAIALQRVGFGLLLIVAFSLGLAAVLVGIGLLLVYARSFFAQVKLGGGLAPRLVPVASALLIVVTGVVLVVQALPTA